MLILTRKEQQRIKIGDDIEIAILKIKGGRVEIGITAPQEQQITRNECSFFNRKDIKPPEEKTDRQKFLECFNKFDL